MGLIPNPKDTKGIGPELEHLHQFDEFFIDLFDYDDHDFASHEEKMNTLKETVAAIGSIAAKIATGMAMGMTAQQYKKQMKEAKAYQKLMADSGLGDMLL